MAEVLGLVTARGGSKGLPRKALADLGGRPLIAWTIEVAKAARSITRLVTSTDDPEIRNAAVALGSEAPFLRPAELATDASAHILTVEHALDWLHIDQAYAPDFVVLLQPTSPFRSASDIDDAVTIAVDEQLDAVVGVCGAATHPLLAKRMDPDGTLIEFLDTARPSYARRQDLEPAYAVNGAIFVNRRGALLRDRMFVPPGARVFMMPPERSVDIDSTWDMEIARLLVAAQPVGY